MPRKKRKYETNLTLGYTPEGKRIRKFISADTKAEFDTLIYNAKKEAERIKNPSSVSIGEYTRQYLDTYKSNLSVASKQSYEYSYKKLAPINHIPLKDVTTRDLQNIINKHSEHARSCQLLKLLLHQVYSQAIKDGIIYPINLADDLNIPTYTCKEKRFITDEEMKEIKKCELKTQDRLYLDMLINTGMRPSEALALQWSDVNFDELYITVRRSFEYDPNTPVVKNTKTNNIRQIPISKQFALRLSKSSRNGIFIFACKTGSPITKSAYIKMSARIIKGLAAVIDDVSDINMYTFRHTYATNLYYKAVKPGIISTKKAAQIMGHSEQIFIKRYTHIDDDKEHLNSLRDALNF